MSGHSQRLTDVLKHESSDLLRYFRRRVDPEDAADLLGETAATAWRRVGDLPSDAEAARRWLFTVAHNIYLNHQRGQRRRHALADRVRDLLLRANSTAPAADIGIEVRDAIDRLPPELAELVRLIHWEGLSLADAAEVMGTSRSTAGARYQRAKAELRETLAPTHIPGHRTGAVSFER